MRKYQRAQYSAGEVRRKRESEADIPSAPRGVTLDRSATPAGGDGERRTPLGAHARTRAYLAKQKVPREGHAFRQNVRRGASGARPPRNHRRCRAAESAEHRRRFDFLVPSIARTRPTPLVKLDLSRTIPTSLSLGAK